MSKIHGKDTKPEVLLRKELWHRGYRYRKNFRKLPGSPDIVMTKYRLCIFVDSEFFHGKGFYGGLESKKYESLEEQLRHSNHPDYWLPKIKRNMERDQEVDAELTEDGWHIIHFWSKDVMKHTDECVRTVEETLADITLKECSQENASDAVQDASGSDAREEPPGTGDTASAESGQEVEAVPSEES